MYFAGKLVYLIVRAFNQLAVNKSENKIVLDVFEINKPVQKNLLKKKS